MSQVLVPMIFTSVPGLMPAPTAPRWASSAPTATGMPPGRPTRLATSVVKNPATRSDGSAGEQNVSAMRASSGSRLFKNAFFGSPPHWS